MAPDPPLITWYGDDMTGSVDVLDALLRAGMSAALFVDELRERDLARIGRVDAVGVAGMTRAMPTRDLRETLRPALAQLASLGAPIVHYKICSTFDSAPETGSVGAALEVADEVLRPPLLPLLVAVPMLGRYTAFGNHFARAGSPADVYRLDRHPTMRRHPVTPMREADLRLELARQTDLPVGLIDAVTIGKGVDAVDAALDAALAAGTRAVLFDAVDDGHIGTIGAALWKRALATGPLPVVGSSGVEQALIAVWRSSGTVVAGSAPRYLAADGPTFIVAGSRSPVTDAQIARAVEQEFVEVAPPLEDLLAGDARAVEAIVPQVLGAIAGGRRPIVHSAGSPISESRRARKLTPTEARRLGAALGAIAEAVLESGAVTRFVVAGGDTSGDVVRRLGIVAFEGVAPFFPSMPLCRAVASGRPADGVELICKAGQIGTPDLFLQMLEDDDEHDWGEVA